MGLWGLTGHRRADPAPPRPGRAAEYVRMSTEHQKYSTKNQSDAIHEFAEKHGLESVQTYADEGKSGLRIDGRDALKRLISDVQNGRVDFETILVYDVSRWGRFQDADESAYYEYICKRAGITVQYCAEQFENDGTPVSTIVKSVKRAMAGEYSRELSAKVFAGQCRLIQLGFRQGGPAGIGLRRLLLDERGDAKAELKWGGHKSLPTDRERPWTRAVVHQVLTNEKYIGNNIFNRVSYKLKERRVRNPPERWVRAEGVFEAIVPNATFAEAREIIQARARRLTDDELLT